jgi:putative transcriptional regulator
MLGATQCELADAMKTTQENISKYERGQTVPPSRATLVIEFAASKGVRLTFGMVYGTEMLPMAGVVS